MKLCKYLLLPNSDLEMHHFCKPFWAESESEQTNHSRLLQNFAFWQSIGHLFYYTKIEKKRLPQGIHLLNLICHIPVHWRNFCTEFHMNVVFHCCNQNAGPRAMIYLQVCDYPCQSNSYPFPINFLPHLISLIPHPEQIILETDRFFRMSYIQWIENFLATSCIANIHLELVQHCQVMLVENEVISATGNLKIQIGIAILAFSITVIIIKISFQCFLSKFKEDFINRVAYSSQSVFTRPSDEIFQIFAVRGSFRRAIFSSIINYFHPKGTKRENHTGTVEYNETEKRSSE